MPATMLTLDYSQPQQKLKPNVLPCKIAYNGLANTELRYWDPKEEAQTGTQTVYFRGRKLLGKTTPLPDGYQGLALQKTDRTIIDVPAQQPAMQDDDEEDYDGSGMTAEQAMPRELKIVEQLGTFDAITVWSHESAPSDAEDPYIKAVHEWINLANAIHS